MRQMLLIFAITVLAYVCSFAQTPTSGTDPQVRILNHIQRFEPDRQVGWSVWAVVPNAVKTDPLRGLGLGGVAFRDEAKKRWIEFMGGAFLDTKGNADPVVDMRFSDSVNKQLNVSGEVMRALRAHRTLVSATATTPLPVARDWKVRAGPESDTTVDRSGVHVGLGGRISVVLPKTDGKVSVATAYQKGLYHQRDVWRTYFLINW